MMTKIIRIQILIVFSVYLAYSFMRIINFITKLVSLLVSQKKKKKNK